MKCDRDLGATVAGCNDCQSSPSPIIAALRYCLMRQTIPRAENTPDRSGSGGRAIGARQARVDCLLPMAAQQTMAMASAIRPTVGVVRRRQASGSAPARRMRAGYGAPGFGPAPGIVPVGLARGAGGALGGRLGPFRCVNVAFVYVPVSHIPSRKSFAMSRSDAGQKAGVLSPGLPGRCGAVHVPPGASRKIGSGASRSSVSDRYAPVSMTAKRSPSFSAMRP